MLRKMPFILLFILSGLILLDPLIPLTLKTLLYTASLTIKSIIILLLPLVVFGLLFKAANTLSHNASKIILLILACVCGSNFISTFVSHFFGKWVYHFDLSIVKPESVQGLVPFFKFEVGSIIPNDRAMFAAVGLGILCTLFKPELAKKTAGLLEKMVNVILKLFTLLLPLFVAGFIVKLNYDGVMKNILKDYARIFMVVALAQFGYITFLYWILNRFKIKEFVQNIRNMLPAAIAGFTTMSSASVMPLTLIGVEKNVSNPELGRSVVPATVNIHLMGDCFAIPIFAYAVLKNFGLEEPSLYQYLIFTFYFVIAKFGVAGIPGGGIIVMVPILQNYLGFNGEMISLITALYILFDPIITSANILGNGSLAMFISKLSYRVLKFPKKRSISIRSRA